MLLLGELVLQFSFGPICWLMISEIFPLRKRGRGSSIAVLLNFGANAIVTFAFSPLQVLICFDHFNLESSLNGVASFIGLYTFLLLVCSS